LVWKAQMAVVSKVTSGERVSQLKRELTKLWACFSHWHQNQSKWKGRVLIEKGLSDIRQEEECPSACCIYKGSWSTFFWIEPKPEFCPNSVSTEPDDSWQTVQSMARTDQNTTDSHCLPTNAEVKWLSPLPYSTVVALN
jgi:hypothetical protein